MSDFGNNVFESLGDAGKRSMKVAADQAKQMGQTVTQQVGLSTTDTTTNTTLPENLQASQPQGQSTQPTNSQDPASVLSASHDEQARKSQEQAKLAEARKKLDFHMKHYYEPTFLQQNQKKELTVKEKNEKEEQEKRIKEQKEFEEMQKKEKIKVPRKTAERKLGIDG